MLSSSNFELPEETLAAGDKCMPDFAPAPTQAKFDQQEKEKAAPSFAPSFQAKKQQQQQQQQAGRTDASGAMVVYNADVASDPFAASDSLLGQADLAAAAAAAGQGQVASAKTENNTAAMLAELEVRGGAGGERGCGGVGGRSGEGIKTGTLLSSENNS